MDFDGPDSQLRTPQVSGIHGARDLQLNNSNFNVIGRDSHTHVHYHGTTRDLRTFLDTISNFRKIQQDTLAKATPGTVVWLLEGPEFRLFIDVNGNLRIMWGSGLPGPGKTILAYESPCHYCWNHAHAPVQVHRHRQAGSPGTTMGQPDLCCLRLYPIQRPKSLTVRHILEVLVKQTVERHPDCFELARQAYDRHLEEGTEPTEGELLQLLGQFSEKRKATFYVLDAIDEAPVKIRLSLIQKLSSLGARLFITSRPLPTLEAKFPAAHTYPIFAQDHDVDLHIAEKIEGSEDLQDLLQRGGTEFKEHLIATVKAKCGGMFLHASLQMDALQQCFTVHDAKQTLEAFPQSIEAVYQQTWERILQSEPHHASLAKATLLWVLNAKQSMTIDLLRQALATSPDTHSFESSRLMPESALVSACRGLITVDKESRLVRLVHYTAKSPLEELLCKSFPHPHSLLAAVCVARLTDCGFQSSTIASEIELNAALDADPLLGYAYHSWVFHAQQSSDPDLGDNRVSTFIAGCRAFPLMLNYHLGLPAFPDYWTPLHIVSFYDLPIALAGPCNAHNTNSPTTSARATPLHLACSYGHHAAAQSLLCLQGILVNARDRHNITALFFACRRGHKDIVELLLSHPDIDVNAADNYKCTALTWASRRGDEVIVKLLLSRRDIEVNLADAGGNTALLYAFLDSHGTIVDLLLSHPGIQFNQTTSHGSTALSLASRYGRVSTVKRLLEFPDIEVNRADRGNNTAIKLAAERGHEEIVGMLLQVTGIDTTVKSTYDGHTAMSAAVAQGHHSIARLLQDFESRNTSLHTGSEAVGTTLETPDLAQAEVGGAEPSETVSGVAAGDAGAESDSGESPSGSDSEGSELYDDALESL